MTRVTDGDEMLGQKIEIQGDAVSLYVKCNVRRLGWHCQN